MKFGNNHLFSIIITNYYDPLRSLPPPILPQVNLSRSSISQPESSSCPHPIS